MSNKSLLLIILSVSLATHFAFFSYPKQIVFDEVHFGKFVSGYYTHEYYFDIHPPLGKLMIAGFAKLFNFKPEFSFARIGEEFPDNKYLALRFLPSLAGTVLPLVVFLLALELGFSQKAAFVSGLLIALENALIVQSRYILMDAFLLLFGFLTLLFYFKLKREKQKIKYLALTAVFGALAVSIKWTGLTFLALAGIIELVGLVRRFSVRKIAELFLFFVAIPFAIYFSVFAVHFSLLTKPGDGDAFMSPQFHQENIFKKFTELNIEMYRSNQRLTATHPYGSKWYTWPFMIRPIYYWVSNDAKIYLLGNPVVWWASTFAILMAIGLMITGYLRRNKIIWILLGGYVLNLLPFIGIKRVMFLYHYLTAVVFAILILAYLIDKTRYSKQIFAGLLLASAVSFIYFAPLTYGLNLTPKAYNQRVWLPSWR